MSPQYHDTIKAVSAARLGVDKTPRCVWCGIDLGGARRTTEECEACAYQQKPMPKNVFLAMRRADKADLAAAQQDGSEYGPFDVIAGGDL